MSTLSWTLLTYYRLSLVMLRQQSYAIKNQLVAKIPPFLLLAGSLWHKDSWLHALKGPIIGANENAGYISAMKNKHQLEDRFPDKLI